MAVSVQMPALGESVTEGTVTRWLKQEGDTVTVDEPLLVPTPAPGGPPLAPGGAQPPPVTDSASTSCNHHMRSGIGAHRCAVAMPGSRSP